MNLDNEMCQFQIRQEDEMERNNVNDREMGDYHQKTSKVVEDIPFVSLLRAKYLFLVDGWYTISTKQSSGVFLSTFSMEYSNKYQIVKAVYQAVS